ncbi:NADH dehydrogenase subunit D [Anopheles sinensis]|uniref:NADH dehydrogenase subunit D n=1 Tax=Anopheles sinensis TaxID=74873 RepID=A0A084VPN5_ANOSI|nr:NADH dehydrogenase subunit D [Anopheles sinensis]
MDAIILRGGNEPEERIMFRCTQPAAAAALVSECFRVKGGVESTLPDALPVNPVQWSSERNKRE